MPRPRYDNVDQKKKDELMRAAMKEFAAHGYELASINRILKSAGFTKGSFYYYFDDKADLAATTFSHAASPETLIGEPGVPSSVDEFWKELHAWSRRQLKQMNSGRLEYECMLRLAHAMAKDPSLGAQVLPRYAPARQRIAAFFQRGMELGAVRSDMSWPLAQALIEAMKSTAYKIMFPNDVVPTEADLESFSDFIIDLAKRITAPSPLSPKP